MARRLLRIVCRLTVCIDKTGFRTVLGVKVGIIHNAVPTFDLEPKVQVGLLAEHQAFRYLADMHNSFGITNPG